MSKFHLLKVYFVGFGRLVYIEQPYCRTTLGHDNKFSKSDTVLRNSYRPCSNMDKYLTTTRVELVGYIIFMVGKGLVLVGMTLKLTHGPLILSERIDWE